MGAPALVIEVLLAPGCIVPGGLQVTERVRANPDLRPCRWDREPGDPFEHLGILDALPA